MYHSPTRYNIPGTSKKIYVHPNFMNYCLCSMTPPRGYQDTTVIVKIAKNVFLCYGDNEVALALGKVMWHSSFYGTDVYSLKK